MHDYLAPMFGDTGATIAQFVITLVVVLLAILLVFWLIRLFTNGRLGSSPARGRQPRLAVLDALPIDQRRRLVLVRRDNVEHLILIGGPADVVVEPGIQRSQQPRRLEPLRTEPQRPEPASRPAPAPQGPRVAAAPIAEPVRPVEPRRPEPAPINEIQQAEPASFQETPRAPEFEPAPEIAADRNADAGFQQAEPEATFEPTPPSPRSLPQRAVPEPRTGRGFPSFLSGNRPRHTPTTADVPQQPMPPPRQTQPAEPIEGRPAGRQRPYDPRPLLGSQQTPVAPPVAAAAPVEPVLAGESDNARQAARRAMTQGPVEAADPFAGLDDEAERLARFEPIFDIGTETTTTDADEAMFGTPRRQAAAPAVEPPQPEDEPVELAEDFIDQARLPDDEQPQSPVSDLEKEMARLLGEISGSRKS
jgi:flagellar protein FliO/FliZ